MRDYLERNKENSKYGNKIDTRTSLNPVCERASSEEKVRLPRAQVQTLLEKTLPQLAGGQRNHWCCCCWKSASLEVRQSPTSEVCLPRGPGPQTAWVLEYGECCWPWYTEGPRETQVCSRNLVLEKLVILQELEALLLQSCWRRWRRGAGSCKKWAPEGTGKPVQERLRVVQEAAERVHWKQAAASRQCPTDKPSVPADTGKLFTGSRSVFTEQSNRVNLQLRGNKSVTRHSLLPFKLLQG